MRRPRIARSRCVLVPLAVLLVSLGSWASTFSAGIVAEGTLVAWLSGPDLEATIDGILRLTGIVEVDGESLAFSSEGTFRGFGIRGIVAWTNEGWIGYETAGHTVDGEALEVCGLLYVRWMGLVALKAGTALPGAQRAVVVLRNGRPSFCGAFTGSVEGAFESPETPGTIQLGGAGVVRLSGSSECDQPQIPLDHPALPTAFLEYIGSLDLGG